MRRTASSILRDLEIRIANLETYNYVSQDLLDHYQKFTNDLLKELRKLFRGDLEADTYYQGDIKGIIHLGSFKYEIMSVQPRVGSYSNKTQIIINGPGTRGEDITFFPTIFEIDYIDPYTGKRPVNLKYFRSNPSIMSGFEKVIQRDSPSSLAKTIFKKLKHLEQIAISDKAVADRAERKRLRREKL